MRTATQSPSEQPDFWAMSYRGYDIAIQRHYRGWLVYLNKVMLQDKVFCDARSAANWLRRSVNERVSATA